MGKGDKDAMKKYNEVQVGQLTRLIEVTRTELPKSERQKVMNMITIDAHSRDMVQVGGWKRPTECMSLSFSLCPILHSTHACPPPSS